MYLQMVPGDLFLHFPHAAGEEQQSVLSLKDNVRAEVLKCRQATNQKKKEKKNGIPGSAGWRCSSCRSRTASSRRAASARSPADGTHTSTMTAHSHLLDHQPLQYTVHQVDERACYRSGRAPDRGAARQSGPPSGRVGCPRSAGWCTSTGTRVSPPVRRSSATADTRTGTSTPH